jgi:hypothetical protein
VTVPGSTTTGVAAALAGGGVGGGVGGGGFVVAVVGGGGVVVSVVEVSVVVDVSVVSVVPVVSVDVSSLASSCARAGRPGRAARAQRRLRVRPIVTRPTRISAAIGARDLVLAQLKPPSSPASSEALNVSCGVPLNTDAHGSLQSGRVGKRAPRRSRSLHSSAPSSTNDHPVAGPP